MKSLYLPEAEYDLQLLGLNVVEMEALEIPELSLETISALLRWSPSRRIFPYQLGWPCAWRPDARGSTCQQHFSSGIDTGTTTMCQNITASDVTPQDVGR